MDNVVKDVEAAMVSTSDKVGLKFVVVESSIFLTWESCEASAVVVFRLWSRNDIVVGMFFEDEGREIADGLVFHDQLWSFASRAYWGIHGMANSVLYLFVRPNSLVANVLL